MKARVERINDNATVSNRFAISKYWLQTFAGIFIIACVIVLRSAIATATYRNNYNNLPQHK